MAITSSPTRRDELRAFLRSRRARLTPAEVGLPDEGRRRTPGLRREELAALAGVGVSWYTWLEQGRDIHPSPDVLDALSRALRLDPAERTTLFALARTELPLADGVAGQRAGEDGDARLETLVALVEGLHPNPAYLMGPMTQILAWNRAATAVFGSPHHLPPERRSLLWMLLVDPGPDAGDEQRQGTARNMLARFRTEYARHAGEPEYERFIAELREHSPRFSEWWGEHEVSDTQRGTKTIEHPELGTLRLHHAQTIPTGDPELRLTLNVPADAATRATLARL